MPAELTIPEKKKGRAGGKMGDKTNSVSETNTGLISSSIDDIDSSGAVPKSTRSLIFNG